ncbi:gram-negative bacteria-binding protein 3 [Stomoxys calcitrans]|uniref:gram-negative bacteria-binding protein 3 n=1 Tax=Stomoxys calcitrans TaxID=35570 RepID=UPI0027E39542|nr:gram-negative bacteria-binding protein 3 [Stomoxys calcitrans]
MHSLKLAHLVFAFWFIKVLNCSAYEAPTALVEVFYPQGFRVSIPHENGISLFAFHGKLNEEMEGLEAGTWARDIAKPKEGRWTFTDRNAKLKLGDTLYYWTYVIYKGLGYREEDGVFVVQQYVNTTQHQGGVKPMDGTKSPPPIASNTSGGGNFCLSSETVVNGAPVRCAKQLVFEENFNGRSLDANKWFVEHRIPQEPDYEFSLYLNDVPEVLTVTNGLATMRAKSTEKHFGSNFKGSTLMLGTSCTGNLDSEECAFSPKIVNILPPFVTARFSTRGKFSFKYGHVTIRAKMPAAMWVYPQLWLEPSHPRYGNKEYRSGQMRLGQTRSEGEHQTLLSGLLLNSKWHSFRLCANASAQKLTEEFHNYQMLWTSRQITFLVDNQEYCHFEVPNEHTAFRNLLNGDRYLPNRDILLTGTRWAPFDQEFSLSVGLGVGGFNDFPDDDDLWTEKKPWINTDPRAKLNFRNAYENNEQWLSETQFQVDYVRVVSV